MRLETPLRDAMREPCDEAAVERMWRGIAARRGRPTRVPPLVWMLAAATTFACIALFFARHRGAREVGPLRLDDGAGAVLFTAVAGEQAFPLSDGSKIELQRGATFEVHENTGERFVGSLRGGVATFDVRPGGPRHWTIDCGSAIVDVVGTRFKIDAQSARVRVEVERGRVRVSERSGKKEELGPGESVDVVPRAPDAAQVTADSSPPHPEPISPQPAPAPSAPAPPVATTQAAMLRSSWQDLARNGGYSEAYDRLGAAGIERATPNATVGELFALADVARLSGHPGDAVAPLERVYIENPKDPRAALAAFTLGRLEIDLLGHPGRAATIFSRAIELGLPSGLVQDAYVRQVEARVKAGDRTGAQGVLDAYTHAFPGGDRSATMRAWLGEHTDLPRPSPSPLP